MRTFRSLTNGFRSARPIQVTQYAPRGTRWFYPPEMCNTTYAFFRPSAPKVRWNAAPQLGEKETATAFFEWPAFGLGSKKTSW